MERQFFKIFNYDSFLELGIIEQQKALIEKGVYIQGQTHFEKDDTPKNFYSNGSQDYPLFIGEDFTFEKSIYTLNPNFLNEVFHLNLDYFNEKNLKNIENQIQTLRLQIEFSGDFSQKLSYVEENYKKSLSSPIFQEFHINKDKDSSFMEDILRRHLSYDFYALSQYILGLKNFDSNYAFSNYYTFLSSTKIIELCDNYTTESQIEQIDFYNNFKTTKFIAMLNELKFFDIDSIKNLTLHQKSKIVLALLQKDYNNKNSAHSVEKNIQVLNPKSELNGVRYTSWTHIDDVRKTIREITNSSSKNF